MSRKFHGISGSSGIASGPTVNVSSATTAVPSVAGSADAAQQFDAARRATIKHLQSLGTELRQEQKPDEAAIFDAQATFAADPVLEAGVVSRLDAGASLDQAISGAVEDMAAMLAQLDDPYLRERAADVRSVGSQMLLVVRGEPLELTVPAGAIVVAADLTPAQLATLRKQNIAGIATANGTATGHVAILARALEIPAVVGLGAAVLDLADGTPAILLADEGCLIVAPNARERARYATAQQQAQIQRQQAAALRHEAGRTSDGTPVRLWANIGHPDEVAQALNHGAEGVGLFRTEFLFLDRPAMPTEDEQIAAYRAVLQPLADRPVVIRTLDVGGDKPLPYLPPLHEANPFLGVRGLRFSMRHPELFRTQLRAMLRAAPAGDLRIMLPMVATVADLRWAVAQLEQVRSELAAANIEHRADVPFGIMLETPAAVLLLDRFIPSIDFCSIGSNDLTQYTLAADRTDGELAQRYTHTDPAVLRMIELAARTAHQHDLPISLCGELAADPAISVVLVGLGITTLSMTPPLITPVKARLRETSLAQAQAQARTATLHGPDD